mgnify:CR=1 FL=1
MFLKIVVFVMTLSPGDDEPVMMKGDVMWYHYTVSTHLFVPTQDHEASPIVHQGLDNTFTIPITTRHRHSLPLQSKKLCDRV